VLENMVKKIKNRLGIKPQRFLWCPEPESNQRHGDFQSPRQPNPKTPANQAKSPEAVVFHIHHDTTFTSFNHK